MSHGLGGNAIYRVHCLLYSTLLYSIMLAHSLKTTGGIHTSRIYSNAHETMVPSRGWQWDCYEFCYFSYPNMYIYIYIIYKLNTTNKCCFYIYFSPSVLVSAWFGHILTISWRLLDPLNIATARIYAGRTKGLELVLNWNGQYEPILVYNLPVFVEYVHVADLGADSVGGPNEISKSWSPVNCFDVGTVGSWARLYIFWFIEGNEELTWLS